MFNIRVYGILINNKNQLLLSDEYIRGKFYNKFPGGGLEPGEGTRDCLQREFLEEMNLKVKVGAHIYTTDYYQQSAFNPAHQIISIYYFVEALEPITAALRSKPFDFDEQQLKMYAETGETETFRFVNWEDVSEDIVSLPIDKIVVNMLKKQNLHLNNDDFFSEEIVLQNHRSKLEPLSEKHYNTLLSIALHKELWEFTGTKIKNEEDFRKYFDTALAERKSGLSYPFAIFDKKENRYAGCTRYANISFPNKRLEIGWTWYHPALQRSGINKATKILLLSYGFETLGLNRIELKTSSRNIKSQGAMLKIGATKEGIFRNHMINEDGVIRDTVYFSFIKEEWAGIKATILKEFNNNQP
ncbi:MAG: GNAT family N-acetyltransferase [Ferruginibacter sp.]|nr:GNAT family N-acetyltransferase [Ferruginibacter sp.]